MFPFQNILFVLISVWINYNGSGQTEQHNKLSQAEAAQGWVLLFNGHDLTGWRGAGKSKLPEKGWKVEEGVIAVEPSSGGESAGGGDIVTEKEFKNFELTFEFNISQGGNSGVKYLVTEKYPTGGSAVGLEYQILDDERHPDAKKGKNGNRTVASLYDLIPASKDKQVNPPGSWNKGRIVFNGPHVEHWLNGVKVVSYDRSSDQFKSTVAGSKFSKLQGFGLAESGHLLLQDHGNAAFFRDIKVRELKSI